MKRSKAFAVTVQACLVLLGLGSAARATDVVWKDVTYHDATITAVKGDQVQISGKRDSDGSAATFQMPLSSVPDDVIHAYRANHNRSGEMVDRPATAQEEVAMKAEAADRNKKLGNLRDMLAHDPYHPVIVAGHIVLKNEDGIVILCDASVPADVPQSEGTVFLKDWPGADKRSLGDPVAVVGYAAGQYVYNFRHIPAFTTFTVKHLKGKAAGAPSPSIAPTPASSH